MYNFVNYVVTFVTNLYSYVLYSINNLLPNSNYSSFLSKNIFLDNSFIGLNLTYNDLFLFIFSWVILLTTIILFIKFICKIFTIFRV